MATDRSDRLILRWSSKERDGIRPKLGYYLRGIGFDGRYYGEVERDSCFANADGQLSDEDHRQVRALVSKIGEFDESERLEIEEQNGVLASGNLSRPELIFRYSRKKHTGTELETLFLGIVAILDKYLAAR